MEIELLNPERLVYWSSLIRLPAPSMPELLTLAGDIHADPLLYASFAAYHEKTALRGEWHREWAPLPFDALVQDRLGIRTSLFYLLANLAALPFTWQAYQRLGIGLDIFCDTLQDFRDYMQDYYDLHGHWGYAEFFWTWRHLSAELFRLGRLQYILVTYDWGVTAVRRHHSPSNEYLLLADPKAPLRADGWAWGAGKGWDFADHDLAGRWHPILETTPDGWRGHRILPTGQVERAPTWLSGQEWELALQPGDTVLELHIPRHDPFTVEDCRASNIQAAAFFANHFPDRPYKAQLCHTWMFSPQLAHFLPSTSNLLHFQREFYRFPYPGSPSFLWTFVFGPQYPDRLSAPRDTSLRRAVLDWLDQGGEIFDLPGLRFHPPASWGSRPYGG